MDLRHGLTFLSLPLLLVCVAGCGPGFPIMTKAQEDLVTNVNRLVKENESLNARLAAIESRQNDGGEMKQDIDALKLKFAGLNSDIDKLHQEFSFVQGAVESDGHDKAQTRESLKSLSDALTLVNGRLSAVEAKAETLKTSVNTHEKRLAEIQQSRDAAAMQTEKPSTPAVAAAKDAPLPPEDQYARGYKFAVDKKYDEAIDGLASFLSAYPGHKLASNAQYWLGEAYYAKGDFERAILEFDKVVKNYPKAEKAAAALLKEGYSFDNLGSAKEARVLLESVAEKFPNSSEAALAKKRLKALK